MPKDASLGSRIQVKYHIIVYLQLFIFGYLSFPPDISRMTRFLARSLI